MQSTYIVGMIERWTDLVSSNNKLSTEAKEISELMRMATNGAVRSEYVEVLMDKLEESNRNVNLVSAEANHLMKGLKATIKEYENKKEELLKKERNLNITRTETEELRSKMLRHAQDIQCNLQLPTTSKDKPSIQPTIKVEPTDSVGLAPSTRLRPTVISSSPDPSLAPVITPTPKISLKLSPPKNTLVRRTPAQLSETSKSVNRSSPPPKLPLKRPAEPTFTSEGSTRSAKRQELSPTTAAEDQSKIPTPFFYGTKTPISDSSPTQSLPIPPPKRKSATAQTTASKLNVLPPRPAVTNPIWRKDGQPNKY